MFKTRKSIYMIISIFIFLLIAFLLVYPVFSEPEKIIIEETNSGVKLSGDRVSIIQGGWEGFLDNGNRNELVLTKFDLINPEYTQIYSISENIIRFKVINLRRFGIYNFNIESYIFVSLDNKTFDEAVEIARNYDLTKENPDPENITVFEPPSPEEVERQQRVSDRNDNPEYIEAFKSCYLDNPVDEIENPTPEDLNRMEMQINNQNDCLEKINEEFLP
jgi:hypothetical protein